MALIMNVGFVILLWSTQFNEAFTRPTFWNLFREKDLAVGSNDVFANTVYQRTTSYPSHSSTTESVFIVPMIEVIPDLGNSFPVNAPELYPPTAPVINSEQQFYYGDYAVDPLILFYPEVPSYSEVEWPLSNQYPFRPPFPYQQMVQPNKQLLDHSSVTENDLKKPASYEDFFQRSEAMINRKFVKILNDFVKSNSTNLDDLKLDLLTEADETTQQIEAVKVSNKPPDSKNGTLNELKMDTANTTTAKEITIPESTESNQQNGSEDVKGLSELFGDLLPSIRPITTDFYRGPYTDKFGNPCTRTEVPSAAGSSKPMFMYTCHTRIEKRIKTTSSPSDVVRYTNEFTTEATKDDEVVKDQTLRKETTSEISEVALNDYVFFNEI